MFMFCLLRRLQRRSTIGKVCSDGNGHASPKYQDNGDNGLHTQNVGWVNGKALAKTKGNADSDDVSIQMNEHAENMTLQERPTYYDNHDYNVHEFSGFS